MSSWEDDIPLTSLGPRGGWKSPSADAIRRSLARSTMVDVLTQIALVRQQKIRERIRSMTPEECARLERFLEGGEEPWV